MVVKEEMAEVAVNEKEYEMDERCLPLGGASRCVLLVCSRELHNVWGSRVSGRVAFFFFFFHFLRRAPQTFAWRMLLVGDGLALPHCFRPDLFSDFRSNLHVSDRLIQLFMVARAVSCQELTTTSREEEGAQAARGVSLISCAPNW